MKCSDCGYEFKENEVVRYHCKLDESGHETIKKLTEPGMVTWIAYDAFKTTVECPKCKAWVKLNGA